MSASAENVHHVGEDGPSESESELDSLNDIGHDEGWEDIEPEDENQPVVGLFTSEVYPNVRAMLNDTKKRYGFDLVKVQKTLDLDYLGSVRLVNYLRSEIQKGNKEPSVSTASLFDDDAYLKPVLEDDALLYSLDDLTDEREIEDSQKPNEKRILELQEELEKLKLQFSEYRIAVQKSLGEQLAGQSSDEQPTQLEKPKKGKIEEADADYFTSYSFNAIHETMLKDTVRTDAYRDFIYDNKGLFKDKIVLDVGCGTGILSMFCARAGAKRVIAVDNSNIIQKARENVYKNGFEQVITCVRGKIEEVSLPVTKVDIIVSEWMGYGLLFEAMLDSVLWARDHYLVPGGLMVPSHTTLRIAPYVDSDFVDSHITFWKSVYGFDMSSMLENMNEEAIVTTTKPTTVIGSSAVFLSLPLHTITVGELSFVKDFEVTITKDVPRLDGWNVWFDTFFMPSPTFKFNENSDPSEMRRNGLVAFTTGPFGTETHWQQCVLLANDNGTPIESLKEGQVIKGSIGYQKKEEGSRALDIEMTWAMNNREFRQQWSLQ